MRVTKVLLIRHGETDDNRRRVFQGQGGRGLNARGREQAKALADRLVRAGASLDALYCSDLERARETADVLGAALALTPREDATLREVALGAWEGLSAEEVAERFPGEWAAWRCGDDIRRGGGETYAELGARMAGALDRLVAAHEGAVVGVVSHGAAIKALVGRVLGTGVAGLRAFYAPPNTSVTVVDHRADAGYSLLTWGDAAHLGDPLAALLARER